MHRLDVEGACVSAAWFCWILAEIPWQSCIFENYLSPCSGSLWRRGYSIRMIEVNSTPFSCPTCSTLDGRGARDEQLSRNSLKAASIAPCSPSDLALSG